VVIASGQTRRRSALASWNSSGRTPNLAGSLPTSLRAVNLVQR